MARYTLISISYATRAGAHGQVVDSTSFEAADDAEAITLALNRPVALDAEYATLFNASREAIWPDEPPEYLRFQRKGEV